MQAGAETPDREGEMAPSMRRMSAMALYQSSHGVEHDRNALEYIHQHRIWFTTLGVALIALGMLVAASSVTATLVSILFLSGVLMLESIIRIIAAFSAREWAGSLLLLLAGAFYMVAGVLTFKHPVSAAAALTLLFAILFLAMGFFRLITSIWYQFPNWGGVALSGAISIALGLMLWNSWPASGLWFIGLCIGIDLIVEGAGWLGLSIKSR
jgi:uncharacterized membrane protein HdeD (DUF308 family)